MWSFLHPEFLIAAGAAAIPLILHLLHRRRTVSIPFSTIRFLKLAQKRSANRIKMENLLLWIVRTLLMLLIALAFAIPILRTKAFGSFIGSAARDVAIVWDVSYSMSYESGSRRVWDAAKTSVASIVQGLNKGDRVCVFLADNDVTPLIEQPTTDLDLALSLIKSQEPRPTSSQLRPATQAALAALKESSHREREVYLVTDGQALPWSDFGQGREGEAPAEPSIATIETNAPAATTRGVWDPKAVDKSIVFFVASLGVQSPENVYPLNVEVQPALLMADTLAKVSVKLGHSGPAQNTSVTLYLDDKEDSRRNAILGADRNEELVFNLAALPMGIHAARIETPVDGLAIDNTFHFLLRVRDQLPVLVAGSVDDAFFLMKALNPGGQSSALKVNRIELDALATENLNEYSCIFLCNALPLSGQALLPVENYARRGGVLVIFPGDRGTAADYESWSCLPAKPKNIEDNVGDVPRRAVRLMKPLDPLFRSLKLPPGTVPSVTLRRALVFDKLAEQSESILNAGADKPFLLGRYFGSGRVLVFAVSADRRWSDLPLSPFFLPIVHQIVQFGAGVGKEKLFVTSSKTLSLTDIVPDAPEGSALQTPSQVTLPIRRSKKETGVTLEVENVMEPGVYRLAKGGVAGETVLAVNVPRAESNLTPIPLAEIPGRLGVKNVHVAPDKEELLRQIEEHRVGRPLGETLLWAVFALGLLELWLANKFSRKKAVETKHVVVQASGRVLSKAA